MNLRKAYGEALVEAGKLNKDVVVLEADLGKSTMSIMFKEAFPDRYFEMGIAEANMSSTAAGFALAGKIPFTGTFAVFAAGRAYDQIRCSIAIPEANVKIIGSSCGLSDYGDGKTHQSVEDSNIITKARSTCGSTGTISRYLLHPRANFRSGKCIPSPKARLPKQAQMR